MNAVNTLDYYKTQLGSLDSYIGKFQDVNYYKNSPCFTAAGCPTRTRTSECGQLASESQKKANDALFKGLDRQQTNLTADAATLQRLQSAAQGAQGQMQAIGYANQLASQQANQLLQIRGLLIAQQNAMATKMQADADSSSGSGRTTAPGQLPGQPGAHLVRGIHESNQGSVLGLGRPRGGLGRRLRQQAGHGPHAGSERRELQAREHRQDRGQGRPAGFFVAVLASWWGFQAQPEREW
jgi:hypothetical protein